MTSDDDSVRRLWEEIIVLRKAVKDAEAKLQNLSCRMQCLNGTARLEFAEARM